LFLITLFVFAIIVGAGLSLLASDFPDGLEWSYAERPDQPHFESVISNEDPRVAAVDNLQSKYSLLPDYSGRTSKFGQLAVEEADLSAGWTSFAGVVGSAVTMGLIWIAAWFLRKRRLSKA